MNMPQPKPALVRIALAVQEVTGVTIDDLRSLTRATHDVQRARWVMGAAAVALGHNAREVSRYMQRSDAYVAKVIEQHKADAEQVKAVVEKVRGQA